MNTYNPDKWVIVKFKKKDEVWYKVLGTWVGGYLHGASWRMSSGLEKVEDAGEIYKMHNYSGSIYECHKQMEQLHYVAAGILEQLKEQGKKEKVKVSVIKLKQYLKETK